MSRVGRIAFLALLLGGGAACVEGKGSPEAPGSSTLFQTVVHRARALAAEEHLPPPVRVTPAVAALDYVQMRGVQYRREAAVWRGEAPFELQLFHPGGGFRTPVRIHLVEEDSARLLAFDPSRFFYGDEVAGLDLSLPADAGYAGFRVLYPLNDPGRMDEVISFLGASYFRLLGPGQVYGLSSRGIAVEVAGREGEEFPGFTDFWVVKPAPGDRALVVLGLLDGPSLTGAYRFRLTPGAAGTGLSGDGSGPEASSPPTAPRGTVLEVEARLFARRAVGRLGVAPLTSMYLHGTFRAGGADDFRPRVHDSEGLLMRTGDGEWIWRPLTNGARLRVTSLRDTAPAGYGLVQRERDFESYLDLEARYDLRPSQWVEIVEGDWGAGGVELVEFPTDSEFNDNIVAYWAPDGGMGAGEERRYRYRLVTFGDRLDGGELPGGALEGEALGRVVRTRIGRDALPGAAAPPPPHWRRVVVDFAGGPLAALAPGAPVDAVASTSAGEAAEVQVLPLPGGGRRATFSLRPPEGEGADVRLFLVSGERVLTETWSYLWEPGHGR